MQGLHILHLEDNPEDAELIAMRLAASGITCTLRRVETHAAFTKALDEHVFDAILSDYRLPAFDGLAALEIARQRCPDVPFIFIVGLTEPRVTELALEKGAAAYLLKDEPHTLAPAVLAVLDKNQMARQR